MFLANRLLLFFLAICAGFVPAATARQAQSADNFVRAADDYMSAERYKDAVSNYSKAIKIDKTNPTYYQLRATAEFSLQAYKGTVNDLSKALSLNPSNAGCLALRARAYDALGQYKKEKHDLDAMMALLPNDGTNLLWRARLNERFKNAQDVIADCDKALNLAPDRKELSEIYMLRSTAYKQLGKKTESEYELAKYRSLAQ